MYLHGIKRTLSPYLDERETRRERKGTKRNGRGAGSSRRRKLGTIKNSSDRFGSKTYNPFAEYPQYLEYLDLQIRNVGTNQKVRKEAWE